MLSPIPCNGVCVWRWLVLLLFASTASLADANRLRIHFVPHTHDDAGWLKTVDQYYLGSKAHIQPAAVQYILDTVVTCLLEDSSRTFSYAEISFFERWWRQQSDEKKEQVQEIVQSGRLTFINGGWVQHDEATTHYSDMIDQTTRGHDFLLRTFNVTPTVAWQIDPFGHSSTQASLLTSQAGFDAVFFARSDYDSLNRRKASGKMEGVWRPSETIYGTSADTFVGNFPNHYGPPAGFNYEWGNHDAPIQDDPSLEDYNLLERVNAIIAAAESYSKAARGHDIMFLMGTDFTYANALTWYKNIDKLLAGVNADGRAVATYSTPVKYLEAKAGYPGKWPLITEDFMPYADSPHTFWTGYFTSRPALKAYIRKASGLHATLRKVAAALTLQGSCGIPFNETEQAVDDLGAAVALNQHHDAITGTSKQHVANDYALRLSKASATGYRRLSRLVASSMFLSASCRSCSADPVPKKQARSRRAAPDAGQVDKRGPTDIDQHPSASHPPDPHEHRHTEPSSREILEQTGSIHQKGFQHVHSQANSEKASSDLEAPGLTHCELSNVTACAVSVNASRSCDSIMLVLVNSVAWPRVENVKVPLARPDCQYTAVDSMSQALPSSIMPTANATTCLLFLLDVLDMSPLSDAGQFELSFQAQVPPLGYSTVLLIPKQPSTELVATASSGRSALELAAGEVQWPLSLLALSDSSCDGCAICQASQELLEGSAGSRATDLSRLWGVADPSSEKAVSTGAVLENGHLKLQFDTVSGRLRSVLHKDTGKTVRVDMDLVYWESRKDAPYGGAYVMRPGAQVPLSWRSGRSSATLEIVSSPVVSEARQAFAPWGTMIVRLWAGAKDVEVVWTVGPVPVDDLVGKEVALRITTDLQSGDTWWTDANSRQMQLRRRNWRQSWALNVTEPVAGNFYPITSAVTLRGTPASSSTASSSTTTSSTTSSAKRGDGTSSTSHSSGGQSDGRDGDSHSGSGSGFDQGSGEAQADTDTEGRETHQQYRNVSHGVKMELTIVTDRPQAAASLESGSMHVLLHRRLLQDDNRGVAEHLDETMCGCRGPDCACPGLISRGTFRMVLGPHSPDTSSLVRTLQTTVSEPTVALYAPGNDVLEWICSRRGHGFGRDTATTDLTPQRPGSGGPGKGNRTRSQGNGKPGLRGDGGNSTELQARGVGDVVASHPLAKAVLKRLGDGGIVQAEFSGTSGSGTKSLQEASPEDLSPWKLHWSALDIPHYLQNLLEDSVPDRPQYTLPSHITLLTFSHWHGSIFSNSNTESNEANSGVGGAGAWPWAVLRDKHPVCSNGGQGAHYLIRLANVMDPSDPAGSASTASRETERSSADLEYQISQLNLVGTSDEDTPPDHAGTEAHADANRRQYSSDASESLQLADKTVDLCKLVSWPIGSKLSIVETTLTANRALKGFRKARGRLRFDAEDRPVCFKDNPSDCKSPDSSSSSGSGLGSDNVSRVACAASDAVERMEVDCGEIGERGGRGVEVCIDPMQLRTFVVRVSTA